MSGFPLIRFTLTVMIESSHVSLTTPSDLLGQVGCFTKNSLV